MYVGFTQYWDVLMHKQRFILTGGPATGKTSCVHLLKNNHYAVFQEVARSVIEESLKRHSDCVPWLNLSLFSNRVFDKQLQDYYKAIDGLNFYDRSPIDVLAYMEMGKIKIPLSMIKTCEKLTFEKKVFLFPYWEHLFQNDDIRKESEEKAMEIEYWLKQKYTQFNYTIIQMPLVSIQDRVNFILQSIAK
jgi:predicted ATPase